MALSATPSFAMEEEWDQPAGDLIIPSIKVGEVTRSNPLLFSSGEESITYNMTYEDLVADVRAHMVAREPSFSVHYQSSVKVFWDSETFGAFLDDFIDDVFAETESPVEGDYLHWSYSGCAAGASWNTRSNNYYYTVNFSDVEYHDSADQEAEVTAAVEQLLESFDFDEYTSVYEKVH